MLSLEATCLVLQLHLGSYRVCAIGSNILSPDVVHPMHPTWHLTGPLRVRTGKDPVKLYYPSQIVQGVSI